MTKEWVSAHKAFELVIVTLAPRKAVRAICTRAAEGMLASRATKLVIGDSESHDCDIPAAFWRPLVDDEQSQDWTLGVFWSHIGHEAQAEGVKFCRAYGVEFARDGVVSILPAELRPKKSGRGAPLKYDWEAAADAVHERISEGRLNPKQQSEVEKAFHDYFAELDLSPGESTVRTHAKQLWEALG